jgi:hypothetical protein
VQIAMLLDVCGNLYSGTHVFATIRSVLARRTISPA